MSSELGARKPSNQRPKWLELDEMPESPAYAPKWEKRSYGGHAADETVIRIGMRIPILVPFLAFVTAGVPAGQVRSLIVSSIEGET